MEGLGVAASVIAVVDLSAKVATICLQYSKEVLSARADIQRFQSQVKHLGVALQATQHLVGQDAAARSLSTSRELLKPLHNCIAELQGLEKRLDPKQSGRSAMRRFGLRALKWPFSSKEVDQLLASLERHEKTILLALQADQTVMLINIQEGVKQLGLEKDGPDSTAHKAHFMVPFPPDPDFVRRPDIEDWMRDQYDQEGRQRMALVGMGGFGKSQLAIHFTHRLHAEDPATSIFWIHGVSKASFEKSYRALADVLDLPRRYEPQVDVLALVRDWLQREDVNRWLMILDNADDMDVFFPKGVADGHDDSMDAPLASFLPKSTRGKIIVTSRSMDAAERLAGSTRVIHLINVMSEEQAHEVLVRRLQETPGDAAAIGLVQALGCIPLAINQAAAYINRRSPRLTVESYLDEFQRTEKRKDSLLRSDKGDLGRNDGVSNSVVVTWQVTFEQIRRSHPQAANLLSLMSRFQAQGIPELMLRGYSTDVVPEDGKDGIERPDTARHGDKTTAEFRSSGEESASDSESEGEKESAKRRFEDDIEVLRGYCLVTSSGTTQWDMHPLVQFCTRSWIIENGVENRWDELFLSLAAHHFPEPNVRSQRLLTHIESFLLRKRPAKWKPCQNLAKLSTNMARYKQYTGHWSAAETLASQAVKTWTTALGPEHPRTVESRSILLSTLFTQDKWEEAQALVEELLASQTARLGAEHESTVASMAELGIIYSRLGRYDDAEQLNLTAVEVSTVKLGPDHSVTLSHKLDLAHTFTLRGYYDLAEIMEKEVLQSRRRTLGPEHPDTMSSMSNLAVTYLYQSRWAEAAELAKEAVKQKKAELGPEHPKTVYLMEVLNRALMGLGRRQEAIKVFEDIVEQKKARLGDYHPEALSSIFHLAGLYRQAKRDEEALALIRACGLLDRQTSGGSDPDTKRLNELQDQWQKGFAGVL
ncbi:kinesin light chain 3 [Microdochium trichocladiopsis]|uniref:Kinesin light chain 3 n=1 Tax=Microdochium trichocladiopsis TaxID=1682393 RepID=A0A9P8Y5D1_9PEZI|nr:kinesin light chain 3 [Microdochium trichocladiopsis]KAH7030641.1 kinesin light chain 3 [Microdochium trichocladiopsis]